MAVGVLPLAAWLRSEVAAVAVRAERTEPLLFPLEQSNVDLPSSTASERECVCSAVSGSSSGAVGRLSGVVFIECKRGSEYRWLVLSGGGACPPHRAREHERTLLIHIQCQTT